MSADDAIVYFTEENSAEVVLARNDDAKNERLQQVMRSVVTHLHAVVKEVEPTMEEWMQAIQYLTAVGQKCDDKRQEWILLSDTLGVSMLVDAINSRRPSGATENTVLGPFHVPGAPERTMGDSISMMTGGEPLYVSGRVTDTGGNPVDGAVLDVWQATQEGFYDSQQPDVQPEMNLRGIFRTGADGAYAFCSIKPAYYPIPFDGPVGQLMLGLGRHPYRPAHIHFILGAEGYQPVTTHVFVKDDPYLKSDAVFGVKSSLVREFMHHDDPDRAATLGLENPFWTLEFDFVLTKA